MAIGRLKLVASTKSFTSGSMVSRYLIELHGCFNYNLVQADIGSFDDDRSICLFLDNYLHRADVRKALASNQDWIEQYFGKILPMMSQQTNVGMESMVRPSKPDIFYPQNPGLLSH